MRKLLMGPMVAKGTMKSKRTIQAQVQPVVMLPCPFCDSQPGPLASEIDGSLICDTCGARGPTHKFEWMKGQDGIRGRWNIRST